MSGSHNISVREECLRDLAAELATMTVANGYATSFGNLIIRGKRPLSLAEFPAVTVFDGQETHTKNYGVTNLDINVVLEFVLISDTPSEDSWRTIADVYRLLAGWVYTNPPIRNVNILAIEPRYPDAGSNILIVAASIVISTRIVSGNPYNQP